MGLIKKPAILLGVAAVATCGLAACSSDSAGSADGANYILANGSEPQNPLIPTNTTETGGGRLIDIINSGLVYYDTDGAPHNELAESIELEGDRTYKVTLKEGLVFSDETPIKAENFVKAWNFGMEHEHQSAYFFEPIKGFEEGKAEMEGLKVIDDRTFTIELNQPEADFPLRLGYSAYFPLPDVAFEDIDAYGENPLSSGPYKLQEWNHGQNATVVPNEHYDGPRKAQNDGVLFTFYPKPDAAYSDLLAGNLDVLDQVPDSAFGTFQDELGDRSVQQPTAVFQSFTIPERLAHFDGEEGTLRRQAISMAINRQELVDTIFQGTREPAEDFTSPVIDGFNPDLKGKDVLEFNPDKAKELWAQADAISPFEGPFEIAYNADGGHDAWVDAVCNYLRENLGIEAHGRAYPDFKSFRDEVTNRTIDVAFRTGWQADYPGLGNFLGPIYATGGSSNDGDYSNPQFDAKLKEAAGAPDVNASSKLYNEAQEYLLEDLPAIPLWYSTVSGGYSENVDNVKFNWKSVPEYFAITKK